MKTTDDNNEKVYVDPILIKEGFFADEEDYVRTMDKMFAGLRKAGEAKAAQKKKSRKNSD